MSQIFINNFSDLCEHQRSSYYSFLYRGIMKEFLELPNPTLQKKEIGISDQSKLYYSHGYFKRAMERSISKLTYEERIDRIRIAFFPFDLLEGNKVEEVPLYFFPNEINVKGPFLNFDKCVKTDKTYCIQVYLPCQYIYPYDAIDYLKLGLTLFPDLIDIIKIKTLKPELSIDHVNEKNLYKFFRSVKDKFVTKIEIVEDSTKFEENIRKDLILKFIKNTYFGKLANKYIKKSLFKQKQTSFPLFISEKKFKKLKHSENFKKRLKVILEKLLIIFRKINNEEVLWEIAFDSQASKNNEKSHYNLAINQNIFLGEIPLMTDEGTFLVTGCERVVVSQILRSPGIYFLKNFNNRCGLVYTASIISDQGFWTRFTLLSTIQKDMMEEIDEEDEYLKQIRPSIEESPRFGSMIHTGTPDKATIQNDFGLPDPKYPALKLLNSKGKRRDEKFPDLDHIFLEFFNSDDFTIEGERIYLYDFLRWFGVTKEMIAESINHPQLLRYQQYFYNVYEKYDNIGEFTYYLARSFFEKSPNGCFSVGEKARHRLNKKLGTRIPINSSFLTLPDFLAIFNGLLELKYCNGVTDDIDHLKNKYIRSVGELLQLQVKATVIRFQDTLSIDVNKKERLKEENYYEEVSMIEREDHDNYFYDAKYLTSAMRSFFKTSPLAQFMDQINPLAELAHKRRISTFGPNGLSREHVSIKLRDIHPSQYGRLCPVETPEGQHAGLISSLALLARIGEYGWISAPYFLLSDGKIDQERRYPLYLNAAQEAGAEVGFSDVLLDKKGNILSDYISVKKNYSFLLKRKKEVKFLITSPLQIFSLGAGLIPFIEHNDANRALMGANMQRQAVPLLIPQKAIVGTGLESIAILDASMVLKSFSEGIVLRTSSKFLETQDLIYGQKILYTLVKYRKSNQDTVLNQCPLVWPNEKIFRGQILTDASGTLDGELALGRNLLVAYMPWEGYNFEDAIIINENLLVNDSLTSIHIHKIDTSWYLTENRQEYISLKYCRGAKYRKRNLGINGVIKVGSYVRKSDLLVGKIMFPSSARLTRLEKTINNFGLALQKAKELQKLKKKEIEKIKNSQKKISEEIFLKKAISQKLDEKIISEKRIKRDISLRVDHGEQGRVLDVRFIPNTKQNILDKEGNYNLKVKIRIFIGQIRKIEVGDKLSGRHGNKGVISKILPSQDMPYLPDGTPIDIILNPLGVPSRMNVGQLFECLLGFAGEKLGKRYKICPFDEIYGKEASRILVNQKLQEASLYSKLSWFPSLINPLYGGKIFLRDGRTGEYFDNPITVGRSYILKLIHLVEEKIHARSIGPYSMVTEQPLAGKSLQGGQRFGEMEVWALEAHGCSYTLHELLTIKSDDIHGREDMTAFLSKKNYSSLPSTSISEGLLLLIRELNALCFDFSLLKINETSIEKINIFNLVEEKLKLRHYLQKSRSLLHFAKLEQNKETKKQNKEEKLLEKKKKNKV